MVHRRSAPWRMAFALLLSLTCGLSAWAEDRTDAPQLVPLPDDVPAPQDNPTTAQKAELGRLLFFDPRLSGDNSMSCATCHVPDKAYGDGLARGRGAGGKELARNTPTVLNTGFYESLFWDGRAASLEEQALGPITSPSEMNQSLDELEKELSADAGYVQRFQQVFGRPSTERISPAHWRRSNERSSPATRPSTAT